MGLILRTRAQGTSITMLMLNMKTMLMVNVHVEEAESFPRCELQPDDDDDDMHINRRVVLSNNQHVGGGREVILYNNIGPANVPVAKATIQTTNPRVEVGVLVLVLDVARWLSILYLKEVLCCLGHMEMCKQWVLLVGDPLHGHLTR